MTCKVCRHMREYSMPSEIVKRKFCHWGPPHLTQLPNPNGMMMLASPPPVPDDYECAQFELDRTKEPSLAQKPS